MGARRPVSALVVVLLVLVLSACGAAVAAPAETTGAPSRAYAVGVRTLDLRRGASRPLPTTVWYPAAGRGGRDAPVASGRRFPLIVYSHGLNSQPADAQQLTTRWAAEGFVVVAPTYPHTHKGAPVDRADLPNQPADAWTVVDAVSRLDGIPADLFDGRLDTGRIAAVGHSGGAYTAAAMFTAGHSARLRGAVVVAGARPRIDFGGPAAPMLFVHGSADPTVPYATGRATYDRVPWPKAFLTLPGLNHGSYLSPGQRGYTQVMSAVTDFLRWTLYGDQRARHRIPADADRPGVAALAGRL